MADETMTDKAMHLLWTAGEQVSLLRSELHSATPRAGWLRCRARDLRRLASNIEEFSGELEFPQSPVER